MFSTARGASRRAGARVAYADVDKIAKMIPAA
jgi:hypothetical protein